MTKTNDVSNTITANNKTTEVQINLADKTWLNNNEMSEYTSISKSALSKYRMSSNPSNIPFVKINGKFILYPREQVDTWLLENQVNGNLNNEGAA